MTSSVEASPGEKKNSVTSLIAESYSKTLFFFFLSYILREGVLIEILSELENKEPSQIRETCNTLLLCLGGK
jgi:hypothetical protein